MVMTAPAPVKTESGGPPPLLAEFGLGPDVAGALLVAAGVNPHRFRTEACFAALCGVSPLDASSGRQRDVIA